MDERLDELKGQVKEGAGELTGNERLEAEGEAEQASARTERNVKGAGDQLIGGAKEGLADLTGDRSLEAEGEAQGLRGDARRT